MKQAKWRVYRLLPLSAYRRLVPRDVIGVHYHVVSDRFLPHIRHLHAYKTPEQFERDLVYLRRNFHLLTYEQLLQSRSTPEGGGDGNALVVTFDDGYAECFSTVRPLLLKHGVPCIFFVTTGSLDNRGMMFRNKASLCIDHITRLGPGESRKRITELGQAVDENIRDPESFFAWVRARGADDPAVDLACDYLGVDTVEFLRTERPYLTREEVKVLATDGFTIGAHTRTHPLLGALRDQGRLEDEIAGSCDLVRNLTGGESIPFAFPFSGDGVDRRLLEELRIKYPFIGLIFDTRRLGKDRPFVVNRIPVDRPPLDGGARSNLPDHLARAYVNQVVRDARARVGARHGSAA